MVELKVSSLLTSISFAYINGSHIDTISLALVFKSAASFKILIAKIHDSFFYKDLWNKERHLLLESICFTKY